MIGNFEPAIGGKIVLIINNNFNNIFSNDDTEAVARGMLSSIFKYIPVYSSFVSVKTLML